jgi:tRNA modification GTPase
MLLNDTIVALATPQLTSALALIRISGKQTYPILSRIFSRTIARGTSSQLWYGKLMDNQAVVDEVMVSCYFAPHSYTGEDLAEISCHGNLLIINRILRLLVQHGARLAEKGEFTKKAFYHGKMDLVQAEAIHDLIQATSESAIDMSLEGVLGNTSKQLLPLKQQLQLLAGHIDVNIDYPEYEDIEQLTVESILPILEPMVHTIEELLQASKVGSLIKDGIKVAIVGKPNVGKSSLLNAFLNEDKAIVSEYAGTTRDVVEGSILIQRLPFHFFDTAGIHDTKDFIENIGIEKSRAYIGKSDFVLLVVDGSRPLDQEDQALFSLAKTKKHLVVINKKDLPVVVEVENGVQISSLYKDIEGLKQAMIQLVGVDLTSYTNRSLISNARQIGLLQQMNDTLQQAIEACHRFEPVDILSIHIKEALYCIQDILGEVAKTDLDDVIFSHFCLGK